jgi:hypothetical protein
MIDDQPRSQWQSPEARDSTGRPSNSIKDWIRLKGLSDWTPIGKAPPVNGTTAGPAPPAYGTTAGPAPPVNRITAGPVPPINRITAGPVPPVNGITAGPISDEPVNGTDVNIVS